MALRNVLKSAIDDGYCEIAQDQMLEEPPSPSANYDASGIDQLIAAAPQKLPKNGQQLADYLRFLAFAGAREKEALRVKWADVDFERERVTIGADRLTKNGKAERWNLILSLPRS